MEKPPPVATGVYLMDLYGRVSVIVRLLTNAKKSQIHSVQIAEYGTQDEPRRITVRPKDLERTVTVEGIVLPEYFRIRLEDIEMQGEGWTTCAPIRNTLRGCLDATVVHAIEWRKREAVRCVTDQVPDATAFVRAQATLRLWCRHKAFSRETMGRALQDAMEAHGRVDTPVASEIARTIRIVRHFQSLPPPAAPIPKQLSF